MTIKYVHSCKNSQKCHAKNHLCQIIITRDLDRIKKLVEDSKYYCKNCGRAAHKKENLCNPATI